MAGKGNIKMKLGTPGFQGKRLRQARIALGLTQDSLGMMLGYKNGQSQQISALETGADTPSPEVMQRLLTITKQPLSFFTTPVPAGIDNSFLFRSIRSLDDAAKGMAEVELIWLVEYSRYLSKYVDFPVVNLPEFSDIPSNPFEITDLQIREAAQKLRRHWGLGSGPLPNIVNLLEANGFIIHITSHESDSWDAVSTWDSIENRPFILANSRKESYFRLRFTIVHEIFHIIFHRNVSLNEKDSKHYLKEMERQANLFAGEFSLPAETFPMDIFAETLDVLRVIKGKWGISIAAMLYRLGDLGIIEKGKRDKLWANYRRRWRDKEPLEDTPIEQETVLKSTIALLYENNILTPDSMLSNIIFSQEVQEGFVNMGDDFWKPKYPQVKVLKMFG